MKIIPESNQDIAEIIASEFHSFGGGKKPGHIVFDALSNQPLSFANGANIKDVVDRVIELHSIMK